MEAAPANRSPEAWPFAELCSIRHELGKSQSEMAQMLGVSTRAVQSYEQGWREPPPGVRRLALFLLYLSRRQDDRRPVPCWEVAGCAAEARGRCPAHELCDGEHCWLVTGNLYRSAELPSWRAKAACCAQCPVMRERLAEEPPIVDSQS